MVSTSDSCKDNQAIAPDLCFCKGVISSTFPVSKSNSKFDKYGVQKKGISAPSHISATAFSYVSALILSHASASISILVEFIIALNYNEEDLMKILKIILKIKGPKLKSEFPSKRPLKAKVSDVYFGKSHMECYYFC